LNWAQAASLRQRGGLLELLGVLGLLGRKNFGKFLKFAKVCGARAELVGVQAALARLEQVGEELAHKSFLKKLLLFLKNLVSLQQQNLIEKINENSKKNTKMGRDNPTATHRSNGGYTLLLQGYYQRKSDCYC
jgi:hypothetical protein